MWAYRTPKPKTLNPKTLNPKTLNPKPWTLRMDPRSQRFARLCLQAAAVGAGLTCSQNKTPKPQNPKNPKPYLGFKVKYCDFC